MIQNHAQITHKKLIQIYKTYSLLHTIMGFDLTIHAVFLLCSDTGKPYCFNLDNNKRLIKSYDLSVADVPAAHRRMMKLRGGILHAYTTKVFDDYATLDMSVSDFLDKFPTWDEVHNHDPDCDYWTEKDHNEFKTALEWLNENNFVQYRVHWSY